MRTRSTQSDPIMTPSRLRVKEVYNGWDKGWQDFGDQSGYWLTYNSSTMIDQKTPGYFKAVREGTVIPVSPMTKTSETIVYSQPGYTGSHRGQWGSVFHYDLTGTAMPNGSLWGVAPQAPEPNGAVALQEALSRAQTDAYDALTFAAEFRQTVEGVATLRQRAMTIFERFENRVRKSTRKRRFRAQEASQILAEIWLEMRYMWRPLVYDMYAAEEAIRRLQEGIEDPLQRAYATREDSTIATSTFQTSTFMLPNWTGGVAGLDFQVIQSAVVERSVHASVGLKVTTREITMIDPFVTGWELVPFSFVLDWFVTIGTALSAFSPFATGQLQYATLATKTTTTYRTSLKPVPSHGFTVESGNPEIATHTRVVERYERVLQNPTPTVAIDIDLNVAKIIDLTALWAVINRKTFTRLLRHF